MGSHAFQGRPWIVWVMTAFSLKNTPKPSQGWTCARGSGVDPSGAKNESDRQVFGLARPLEWEKSALLVHDSKNLPRSMPEQLPVMTMDHTGRSRDRIG